MGTGQLFFVGALTLAAGLWIAGALALWRTRGLPAGPAPPGASIVSVVIPARNEEGRIGPLLDSLRKQILVPGEIIVVDDESTDGTSALAKQHGCRVLAAPPRPQGWCGKTWACHCGARAAQGGLLLFLDADVRLEPDALERLLAAGRRTGGATSVQPWHRVSRAYENLSAFCNLTVMIGLDSFALSSVPGRPAGCFGPCILLSRADYARAGGHQAVRSDVVEDVALGKLLVSRGVPVFNYAGRGTIEFSMYPQGLKSLLEGWTKNLSRASGLSRPSQVLLLALWITGLMACMSLPLFLGFLFSIPAAAASLSVWVLHAAHLHRQFRKAGGFSPLAAILFPVPVLFFLFVFFRSIAHTKFRKKVEWKGREISVG
ncbi:MAG: glycosyltransferase [Spirochaetales bacterium]|nr:glycosyltransferase [Spirochaetales bacterium]